jgi:hypothetical protein
MENTTSPLPGGGGVGFKKLFPFYSYLEHTLKILIDMGAPFVIAKDMAQRNAENLAMLKGGGAFAQIKKQGDYRNRTTYEFKEATPEVLAAIRLKMQVENEEGKRKRKLVMAVLVVLGVFALVMILV